MPVTEDDLRRILADRASAAPFAPDRTNAVERRVRGIRRRRAVAASGAVAALVAGGIALVGTDATATRVTPPPATRPADPAPAALTTAFDGGTKIGEQSFAPGRETAASPTLTLPAGTYAVGFRCDRGDVTVTVSWDPSRPETISQGCVASNGVELAAPGPENNSWRKFRGGPVTLSVSVSEPQREPWGFAVYSKHPRWNGSVVNAPSRLGALTTYYTMLSQGGGGGGSATITVERRAARPTFLVECSGAQTVELRINGATFGAPIVCGPSAYERHEVRPSAAELSAAGWTVGRKVTLSPHIQASSGGTILLVTVYAARER